MQMHSRCFFVIAVIMLAVVSQAAAQPTPRMRGAVSVPREIHDVHIDRFAIWLNLSPEQEHAIRLLREEYAEQWLETLPEERQALIELVGRFSQENREPTNFNSAELMSRILRRSELLRILMEEHDERFFERIESMLAQEQKQHMDRVRLWRKRSNHAITIMPLQEAAIDLMELLRLDTDRRWRQFSTNEPDQFVLVTRREYERLQPIINEYELRLVVALQDRARTERVTWVSAERYVDALRSLEHAGVSENSDPAAFEDIRKYADRATIPLYHRTIEVERINRWGLDMFMQHLPEEKAAELKRIYLERAYPRVYPDPESADALYEIVLSLESIDNVQYQAIESLREEYQRRHAALSEKMADARREYIILAFKHPTKYEKLIQPSERFSEFRAERRQLSDSQRAIIEAMLNPEQIGQLPQDRSDK